jgi:hypothetical protein
MQTNKQLSLAAGKRPNGVQIPDLVKQIAFVRHGSDVQSEIRAGMQMPAPCPIREQTV